MSDTSPGSGWWQAADGKWYAPTEPPGPGWWKASDGNWYAPDQPPVSADPAPGPVDSEPETTPEPAAAVQSGKSAKSKAWVVVAAAVFVVLVIVAGVVVVATRGNDAQVASGGSATPTTASSGASPSGNSSGNSSGSAGAPVASGPDDLPGKDITLTEATIVVRGNGGKAVRSFGDDGRTITLDGSAEGADKLAPGKIMLLTGITVVKVNKIERKGDDIVVTGEPATLPEVVRDGDLSWSDQLVQPDQARLSTFSTDSSGSGGGGAPTTAGRSGPSTSVELPDLTIPGMEDDGSDTGFPWKFVPEAATVGVAAQSSGGGKTLKGKLGSMDAELTYRGATGSGHKFALKLMSSGEVSGTINVDVTLHELKHSGKAKVTDSKVQEFDWSTTDWGGDAVITTDLKGLENVATLKLPPFFKLPFGIEFPVLVGGIPFTLGFNGTVQVTVSMALANSSLSGKAEISFSGDAGFHFKGGSATLDGKRIQDAKDPLEWLKGAAPGPVGVVLTVELPKASFGFGFLQTGAGVYISNGAVVSQDILPLPAQCTASNISYVLAGGVEAKFLGKEFEIARKAFVRKDWNYQVPTDGRCNRSK